MSSTSRIALAVAIVLSTASVGMSAPKHSVHSVHHRHQIVAKPYHPPAVYRSFGFVRSSAQPREPGYIEFQDRGIREDLGG
jgi:hypothetical protein